MKYLFESLENDFGLWLSDAKNIRHFMIGVFLTFGSAIGAAVYFFG